uniref:Globin family profile domain-containing protein n=1 Tax=Romanomermis culicivorax TaxID=13658 RepID=A0A915JIP8_ROMCU
MLVNWTKMFGFEEMSLKVILTNHRMMHHFLVFQDTMNTIFESLSFDNDGLCELLKDIGTQHAYFTRRYYDPCCWATMGIAMTDLINDLPNIMIINAPTNVLATQPKSRVVQNSVTQILCKSGLLVARRACSELCSEMFGEHSVEQAARRACPAHEYLFGEQNPEHKKYARRACSFYPFEKSRNKDPILIFFKTLS